MPGKAINAATIRLQNRLLLLSTDYGTVSSCMESGGLWDEVFSLFNFRVFAYCRIKQVLFSLKEDV
jgi:hypothetical protein